MSTEQFKPIPPEILEEIFYDPDTGEFHCTSGGITIKKGYYVWRAEGYGQFSLARILWMLETGEDPGQDIIDHADTNPMNNKFNNLRRTTKINNSGNASLSKANTSGVKGVYWDSHTNRWRARVMHKGKVVFSKYYKEQDLSLAAEEVSEARRSILGQFARDL